MPGLSSKPPLTTFAFQSIGLVRSPFKEKFGIPRQPGLVSGIEGVIELFPPFGRPEAVVGARLAEGGA
jgi:tRNA (adenine37-N6)-methyltransferase